MANESRTQESEDGEPIKIEHAVFAFSIPCDDMRNKTRKTGIEANTSRQTDGKG